MRYWFVSSICPCKKGIKNSWFKVYFLFSTGSLQFKIISFTVFRSVLTTVFQMYLAITIAIWKINHSKYWGSFDKDLNSINDLSLFAICFHGVLGTWRATPAIARAIRHWSKFQVSYSLQIHKHISTKWYRYKQFSNRTDILI